MDRQLVAEAEFWLAQHSTAVNALKVNAALVGAAVLDDVTDWYDEALMIAAAARAAAASQDASQAVSGLAAQYIATMVAGLRLLTRVSVQRTGEPTYRNGLDRETVYRRPVQAYRREVAHGATNREAIDRAYDRIRRLLASDVTMAEREAARRQMAALGVTAYRRVIRPELSESGTCGLCIAAAGVIYKTPVLLPLHDRCNCISMPIVGDSDPGAPINAGDLEALYASMSTTDRAELAKFRFRVDEHGELGPVLSDERHQFTALADIPSPAERAPKELGLLIPVLSQLEARAAAGEDVSAPLKYQRDRIEYFQSLI